MIETPLYTACFCGREEIVKILFASGREIDTTKRTNANAYPNPNKTAAEIARKRGKDHIAKLVVSYSRNPIEIILRLRNYMSNYDFNC